jgi:hypothetical protein
MDEDTILVSGAKAERTMALSCARMPSNRR